MKAEEYAMILDSIFKIKSKEIQEWLDKKDPVFLKVKVILSAKEL